MTGTVKISDILLSGKIDILKEIENDLLLVLCQPLGSMFYNRDYGAGLDQLENEPTSLMMQVYGRYMVVNAITQENERNYNETRDKRVLVSQASIDFDVDSAKGEVTVTVNYIPYSNISTVQSISVPTGVMYGK